MIEAAASLFAADGFNGTTTKQVAKAAGASEALLFKYFPTKRALYTAILEEKARYSELRESIETAAENQDDTRLLTLLASYRIKQGVDPTMFRLLLFSALEGHELSDMFFFVNTTASSMISSQHISRGGSMTALFAASIRYWPPEPSSASLSTTVCCTTSLSFPCIGPMRIP